MKRNVKKGSKRYLKAVARSIMSWLSILKQVRNERSVPPEIRRRENIVKDLDN
jgi:uncharacterized protein (UPF0147 family)